LASGVGFGDGAASRHAAANEEIEITKHGLPVARLVPALGARSIEGSFKGVAMTAVEEEQLFSTGEAWDAS
jgi:antitoxin (DNA-binding transcriptional repressor) of toxin-antitoxin stability system